MKMKSTLIRQAVRSMLLISVLMTSPVQYCLAETDEYRPTDRDLFAAYCSGAIKFRMDAYANKSGQEPVEAAPFLAMANSVDQRVYQHLYDYLDARGYMLSQDNSKFEMIMPAISRGANDQNEVNTSVEVGAINECLKQCTASQTKSNKAQFGKCMVQCNPYMTDAETRISKCAKIEQELPF